MSCSTWAFPLWTHWECLWEKWCIFSWKGGCIPAVLNLGSQGRELGRTIIESKLKGSCSWPWPLSWCTENEMKRFLFALENGSLELQRASWEAVKSLEKVGTNEDEFKEVCVPVPACCMNLIWSFFHHLLSVVRIVQKGNVQKGSFPKCL